MRRFLLLILFGASFWMLSSCSQQYDLATMDKNITVGGDNFVFPLGHTTVEGLKVDSLMDLGTSDKLKRDADGNYYFDYSGHRVSTLDLSKFRKSLEIEQQVFKIELQKTTPGTPAPSPSFFPVDVSFNQPDTGYFIYDFSDALNDGLKRLDSIKFKPSRISVRGTMEWTGSTSIDTSKISLTTSVYIPSRFRFSDSRITGNILKAESRIHLTSPNTATVDFASIYFSSADFSDLIDESVLADTLRLDSLKIHIEDTEAYKSVMGKTVKVDLSVYAEGSEDYHELIPEIVYGLVDVQADSVYQTIKIDGIPEYMRDAVLDLQNPMIRMNVTTNSTVPMKVNSRFLSYNSRDVELSFSSVDLVNDVTAETPEDSVSTAYVISNRELEGEGYQWVYGDIDTLVHTLPTSLTVGLSPGTNTYVPQHRFYLDSETKVSMDYCLTLPLQFGSDMMLSFRDTIAGMPDLLRDVMEKNDIRIIGSASSTMPVNLSLFVRMLDEYGKDVGISCTVPGEIPGTDDPSVPVESEYSVEMKKSSNAKKISMMEMQFVMEDGSGVCLNENNYVKMDIQVSVPGGIELEIKD